MQGKCKKLKDKIIGTFVAKLRESNFYQLEFKSVLNRCLNQLGGRRVEQIICYGLGSFNDGVDIASRYQLALLILLYECLENLDLPLNPVIEVYDPSFEQIDKDTLLLFDRPKFTLMSENEHCARKLTTLDDNGSILVYMPHLDKYLYNNLIGANWEIERLKKLLILGNSFKEMIDNETSLKCEAELYYMSQIVRNFEKHDEHRPYRKRKGKRTSFKPQPIEPDDQVKLKALVEFALDDKSFEHTDIFNSLSFHFIDIVWLENNQYRIEQHRLPGWQCISSNPIDEWAN